MIQFNADLLEPNLIAADGEVDPAQLSLIIAYSTAVSLKRLADATEALNRPVIVDGSVPAKVSIVRSAAKPAAPAPAVPAAPVKIPIDMRPWGGGTAADMKQVAEGVNKPLPCDPRSDVLVYYRRGKSSRVLAAGSVNWAHTGGQDDVIAWRMVADVDNQESSLGARSDGGN